ncbi:hypothetical protein [Streptomyces collinus]|uniref:hypothetical protein n=1 Tax=Streptomyces collinus TaxID=42684 RepID=UPI003679312D
MRGDDFDEITSQVRQTTRRLADEWVRLGEAQLTGDHIFDVRRRLQHVGTRVDCLTESVASATGSSRTSGTRAGQLTCLVSELDANRVSVLDLQRAYSVLQEASELERRLTALTVAVGGASVPPTTAPAAREWLDQAWPLAVGLQAQLDELCVRASRARVPAQFFTWATGARQRLEARTTRISRLKDRLHARSGAGRGCRTPSAAAGVPGPPA